MFRFETIVTEKEIFENQNINLITKKTKCFREMKVFLENQEDAILIFAEGEKNLVGGAALVKQRLKNIQEDVRELVTTLPLHNYVWECSMIFLECYYEYENLGTLESEYLFQSFYREFYEWLVEFGRMKGIGFLIMKLSPEVYDSTKEFGLWPYVVELRPGHSLDGLFHGILPLTGSQYLAYRKSWEVEDQCVSSKMNFALKQ